jgi:hypothetical protein
MLLLLLLVAVAALHTTAVPGTVQQAAAHV